MDIDLSILRMLEREKEISFEVLAEAIEQALLTAYQRATESHPRPARVELDRKTGHVTVWAREVEEYRPYATDDPTFASLRKNLAKYNPAPDVLQKILASLSP